MSGRRARKIRQVIARTGPAPISGEAADIAVSEMSGVPLDQICGWVLAVSRHTDDRRHEPILIPADRQYVTSGQAVELLEQASAALRTIR